METNQEEKNDAHVIDKKKKKIISIIIIVILLLLPIAVILFKTVGNSNSTDEQPTANQTQEVDIPALENAANSNPTYGNLIDLSNAYINNKMPEKSIPVLTKAIALNPKAATAYNNLGVAFTMLQKYQEGIEACTKALQLDSTFQLAKNNLAWAKDEQNKLNAILQQLEQTPENKRNTDFYVTYGLYYLKLGNYDKSIEIWNKILEIDSKNQTALNNIGTAFMFKLQYDDAIILFKKAVEIDSNNQLAKNNLAWALAEKSKAEVLQKK